MMLNRGFLFALLVVVAAVGNASAATYIVGDTLGWTVPPTPAAYSAWASRQVFRVGDVLVFNYNTGFHDVAHVTKAAYDGCSSNNPIALATVGPSNFTLGSAGEDYYICTFGTHCAIGQKLAINVTAATTLAPTMPPSTTPVTPTPTMPPTTTPTPTMPPSTTPTMTPMSPPSSSPSLSPSGAPSMSPSGAMTPGSPMPNGGAPPPAPSSESTPDGSSPPPPPSSATIASVCAPLIVFASVLFALVI